MQRVLAPMRPTSVRFRVLASALPTTFLTMTPTVTYKQLRPKNAAIKGSLHTGQLPHSGARPFSVYVTATQSHARRSEPDTGSLFRGLGLECLYRCPTCAAALPTNASKNYNSLATANHTSFSRPSVRWDWTSPSFPAQPCPRSKTHGKR